MAVLLAAGACDSVLLSVGAGCTCSFSLLWVMRGVVAFTLPASLFVSGLVLRGFCDTARAVASLGLSFMGAVLRGCAVRLAGLLMADYASRSAGRGIR